jgi:hypothetical protein
MNVAHPIRVFCVDDNELVRDALERKFRGMPEDAVRRAVHAPPRRLGQTAAAAVIASTRASSIVSASTLTGPAEPSRGWTTTDHTGGPPPSVSRRTLVTSTSQQDLTRATLSQRRSVGAVIVSLYQVG